MLLLLLKMRNSLLGLVFFLFFVFSASLHAQPTARLSASRLSGPAPLAVTFDATATTHASSNIDTFRQLGYYFDFDDSGSGIWEYSGQSKNRETGGPLAAHVFETPGTYRVGVRASDAQGRTSDAWVNITVTDPNQVFSGTNTFVISRGSNFDGAPVGAQRISNVTSWPAFQSGKRYLLRAGEDFRSLGQIRLRDVSNFQITTFGGGGKAQVASVSISMNENNASNPPRNGVVQNLSTNSIRQDMIFHDLLVFRNILIGNGAGISNGGALEWYAQNQRGTSSPAAWVWSSGFYAVENHIDMNMMVSSSGIKNPIEGGGKWFVALGNYSTKANEHTLRAFYTYKAIIGHNQLTGLNQAGGRHALKMHAQGIEEWQDELFRAGTTLRYNPRSQYVRVHNNILGDRASLNNWTLQVAPQNSESIEGMEYFIVESNRFIGGGSTMADMQTLGHNIIVRGNTGMDHGVATNNYPSGYRNDAYWHGPYFLNDQVPAVSAPLRDGGGVISPPLSPVLTDITVTRDN